MRYPRLPSMLPPLPTALPLMKTCRWGANDIEAAAAALRDGQVVAFPTETVYGAGANAFSDVAVKRIFDAKGRPSDNPLIVHVADFAAVRELVDITGDPVIERDVCRIAEAFWPGPLTLILRKAAPLSPLVTAGLSTVGIRVPDHAVAQALLRACGLPIAGPSANLSGRPSPTTADHVANDLDNRIAGIVDGGATGVGLESTVLDCTSSPYTILRPGGVTVEQLRDLLGNDIVAVETASISDDGAAPRAPGMKYQHYAPSAPLHYIKGDDYARILADRIRDCIERGQRVGVMTPASTSTCVSLPDSHLVRQVTCGDIKDPASVAQQLFACLRDFDADTDMPVDVIFAYRFPDRGLGEAIMNRLLKASTTIIE